MCTNEKLEKWYSLALPMNFLKFVDFKRFSDIIITVKET